MNPTVNAPDHDAGEPGDGSNTRRSSHRARIGIGIASVVVVLLGGTWWAWYLSTSRNRPPVAGASASASAGGDMPGMPGMDMQPGARMVRLTADQIHQFGVTFGFVEQRVLESSVRTIGTVTVDETQLTQVALRFGGFVERLDVDKTGQRVQQGDALMAVYSPELLAAQQELLVAATLQRTIGESAVPGVPGSATDLVTAARRRLQLWDISDAQIDDITRTREPHRTLTVYAPASGVVLEKNVVRGQAVQPGQMLYTIANLGVVWIDIAVREADASAARVGASAAIEMAGLPGRSLDGQVSYVYPTVDSAGRTIRARVTAQNPDGLLKPGMYATVTLTSASRKALTVPTSAVFRTGERTLVFIDHGMGPDGRQIVPAEIEAGQTTSVYTEVLSGLEPGQQVVTSAQFLLDSESNLAEVMKSMIGQMNTSDLRKTPDMKDMPGMKTPSARTPSAKKK